MINYILCALPLLWLAETSFASLSILVRGPRLFIGAAAPPLIPPATAPAPPFIS